MIHKSFLALVSWMLWLKWPHFLDISTYRSMGPRVSFFPCFTTSFVRLKLNHIAMFYFSTRAKTDTRSYGIRETMNVSTNSCNFIFTYHYFHFHLSWRHKVSNSCWSVYLEYCSRDHTVMQCSLWTVIKERSNIFQIIINRLSSPRQRQINNSSKLSLLPAPQSSAHCLFRKRTPSCRVLPFSRYPLSWFTVSVMISMRSPFFAHFDAPVNNFMQLSPPTIDSS